MKPLPLLTLIIFMSCSNQYADRPDYSAPDSLLFVYKSYVDSVISPTEVKSRFDKVFNSYSNEYEGRKRLQQVVPDTIKVRLLYDDGASLVPKQINAWHVYEASARQQDGRYDVNVFLEQNKRKRINGSKIWKDGSGKYIFRVYNWR